MYSVGVLMSTYNGAKYIREQIESILCQVNCEIKLIVRDDGSTDNTISILEDYSQNNKLEYIVGDNLGPAKSFIWLIKHAPECDYYAFADQDDVWMPEKLEKAIMRIEKCIKPAAYSSNMRRVDQEMNLLSEHALPDNVSTDFESVMTVSGRLFGCTMLFNQAMVDFIKLREMPEYIIMHDLWIAMIASLYNNLFYDSNPYINYRTHNQSVTFSKDIPLSKKIQSMFKGSKDSFSKQCEIFIKYVGENEIRMNGHWEICDILLNYKNSCWKKIVLVGKMIRKKDMSFKLRIHHMVQIICGKY